MGFIYLLHEREFINSNQSIFKIGRTERNIFDRISDYPKNSSLLFCYHTDLFDKLESPLIKSLKNKFNHCKHIGNEYFEGNLSDILQHIISFLTSIDSNNINYIINSNTISDEAYLYNKLTDYAKLHNLSKCDGFIYKNFPFSKVSIRLYSIDFFISKVLKGDTIYNNKVIFHSKLLNFIKTRIDIPQVEFIVLNDSFINKYSETDNKLDYLKLKDIKLDFKNSKITFNSKELIEIMNIIFPKCEFFGIKTVNYKTTRNIFFCLKIK